VPSVDEKVPVKLVREAVQTAADFVPRLADAMTRVAHDLQADRMREGLGLFNTAQDGLKWFCNLVELRRVWLGSDPRGEALEEDWPSFVQAMSAAADALGDGDYVLLSDLLLYEVVPFMEKVLGIARSLEGELVGHAV